MMNNTCPVELDKTRLRREVLETYSRVATMPDGPFHFHRGPGYACEMLGYSPAELAAIPSENTSAFAGLGNPLAIGPIHPGETVLDVGCGGGTDLLLAALRTGPAGLAIGVDSTPAMMRLALDGARKMGLQHVAVRSGEVEALPVASASVDVVISNGVLNLAPNKLSAYAEIARVLKPGGRLYLADVSAELPFSEEIRSDPELWAAWVAGALSSTEMIALLEELGLEDARVTHHFDCFRGTAREADARQFAAEGVNVFARKP